MRIRAKYKTSLFVFFSFYTFKFYKMKIDDDKNVQMNEYIQRIKYIIPRW